MAYRKAGYSKKFLSEHETDILLHKAAKQAFDDMGVKILPTIKTLQSEYMLLVAEKKEIYSGYSTARKEMKELLMVKANVDRLLGNTLERKNKKREKNR